MDNDIFFELKQDLLEIIPEDQTQVRTRINQAVTHQEVQSHLLYSFGTLNNDLWEDWMTAANERSIAAVRAQADLENQE